MAWNVAELARPELIIVVQCQCWQWMNESPTFIGTSRLFIQLAVEMHAKLLIRNGSAKSFNPGSFGNPSSIPAHPS